MTGTDLVERAQARLPRDLERRLNTEPLASVLRQSTWGAHEEVETGPLEAALADGRLPREIYADLLAQSLEVYRAIEELAPMWADHPLVGPFVRPEVFRTDAVEADLEHHLGRVWHERVEVLPQTEWYVERIRTAGSSQPMAWIAHSYTRYLADLSGGLTIDRAITEAYGLSGEAGRRLYVFDLPGDVHPTTWKNAYRQLLNALDITADQQRTLILEALVAYQCNIALNDALAARYVALMPATTA